MIHIKDLHKAFGHVAAVCGVSLTIAPGEVLGFLGPNGAGKSTTMKMITGFLAPDTGTVEIFGHDVQSAAHAARALTGYLPEGAPAWGEMTVDAFLHFIADVRGFAGNAREERVEHVLDELELQDVRGRVVDTLSKGYKRRVGLAQAILHDPRVLVLDEPTDGLDPNQKHQVRALIRRLSAGRIIIISTHILEEVTAVCTRAVIIAEGVIVADETPQALERRSRHHGALSVRFGTAVDTVALRALEGVSDMAVDHEQNVTLFPVDGVDLLPGFLALAQHHGWQLKDLVVERGRLDDVFRTLTRNRAA